MQQIRSSTPCGCEPQQYNDSTRCPSCLQPKRKPSSSQYKYTLPERPAKQLTPPPSRPDTPRRSLDSRYSSRTPSLASHRPSYAIEALSEAFSSSDSVSSDDSVDSNFFPPSVYFIPSRSRSRHSSSSPSRPTTRAAALALDQPNRKSSRSATPADRTPTDAPSYAAPYAPMAAGFARLNSKGDRFTDLSNGVRRAQSARPSLELEARMFSGPA